MGLSKQSKILSKHQISTVLLYLDSTRYPLRNKTIFTLSVKSGMRAIEISRLKWNMIVTPTGELGESIHLTNDASKGKTGGRIIPIHKSLNPLLEELFQSEQSKRGFDVSTSNVITTERGTNTSAQVIVDMFGRWYRQLGFVGCSSHSGRRTWITNLSKKVSLVGASLREVQILAGHSNLQTTQRYIDSDKDSHRKLVNLI